MNHLELGRHGEDVAAKWLKKQKHRVLYRNFTTKDGEIDIIAYDKKRNEYVFVEVKTRSSKWVGEVAPSTAVNYKKQLHIKKVASTFRRIAKIYDKDFRFDIIEVVEDEVNHIPYAF